MATVDPPESSVIYTIEVLEPRIVELFLLDPRRALGKV